MPSRISASKHAEPSFIRQFAVVSNKNSSNNADLINGAIRLMYYESILQDTVRVTYTFADSGSTIDNKTAIEGLPIVGEERVYIKFEDNNENKIELTMYVNKVTPVSDDTTKSMVQLELVSKEFILNEKLRVYERFDGKISDHITKILTADSYFKTAKTLDIEETSNTYNFLGNNKKPLYVINFLSKKSVPTIPGVSGKTAGYLFYETSQGFKFKSIDTLLSQTPKKSIIYNQTPDSKGSAIPEGYDVKALEFTRDNRIDVYDKLKIGAFSTRSIIFDPFNCYYRVLNPKVKGASGTEASLKIGGTEMPVFNKEFERNGANKEFSRTTYFILDTGTLPTGRTVDDQINASTTQNFQYADIANQSIMRYNQLFSSTATITIPGDFSLHAGDMIKIDVPEVSPDKTSFNQQSSGLYIISDLCHYISTKETYTKLNLVRDSFGRKPTASTPQ